MAEASKYFAGDGGVQEALRKIASELDRIGVPYAVAGGLALFHHGYRRFTEDVDLLVTRDGLKEIHQKLTGRGYMPPFERSKHLRDTDLKVKIEFLVSGDFPGDGKPKEVAFPNPSEVGEEQDGIRYLTLRTLIELKLASGMTDGGRGKDLVDVQELIRVRALPRGFESELAPFVRTKFQELWQAANPTNRRFVRTWRNKWLTASAATLDEVIAGLTDAARELQAMREDGVVLDSGGGTSDDYALLVTRDPVIAEKYGFEDERDLWDPEVG